VRSWARALRLAACEFVADMSRAYPTSLRRLPLGRLLAHRVGSLRCEGSDAIGAKRTCRERRERIDLTKMTHQRHWLCTAAMGLMPGLSPIKVLI
jgi:hypothetical protein